MFLRIYKGKVRYLDFSLLLQQDPGCYHEMRTLHFCCSLLNIKLLNTDWALGWTLNYYDRNFVDC